MVTNIEYTLKLILVGLAPAGLAILLKFLDEQTPFFKKIKPIWKQIIFGVLFGGMAILATEVSVPMGIANGNVRDSAPILAGLIFGEAAGLISGLIGGIYRFSATYWSQGAFSQWACSISTVFAGIYAAILRRFLFKKKHPTVLLSFFIGGVIEVFHLTMVFLLRLNYPQQALRVVKALGLPMILANAITVMIPVLVFKIVSRTERRRENNWQKIPKKKSLARRSQAWLLLAVVVGFVGSTIAVYAANHRSSENSANRLLSANIEDVETNIRNTVVTQIEEKLSGMADKIALNPSIDLNYLRANYGVDIVSLVSEDGIVLDSTESAFVGFDMDDDPQSKEFNDALIRNKQYFYIQEFMPMASDPETIMKFAGISLQIDERPDYAYIQLGYEEDTFTNLIRLYVADIPLYRHVGENGTIAIADRNGLIITATLYEDPEDDNNIVSFYEKKMEDIGLKIDDVNPMTKAACEVDVITPEGNKKTIDSFFMYDKAETFHVVTLISYQEIYFKRDLLIYVADFTQILVYAILFIVFFLIEDRMIVSKLEVVDSKLEEITAGKLDTKIELHKPAKELDELQKGINSTVTALNKYIEDEKSRNAKELEFAKRIQASALPSVFPAFPNEKSFDIYASMVTAREVGGDFYDFFFVGPHKLCFLVADVSGKGIPAAMFMMESKTMIKNLAATGLAANEILKKANDNLCSSNEAGMFVTCWIGIIDIYTGEVTYANGGHNTPLIYNPKTGWEYISMKKNLVLGALGDVPYTLQTLKLEKGGKLFLYTDGVTEAQTINNELFSEQRLADCLNAEKHDVLSDDIKKIEKDVADFAGEAPQADDITMLVIEYKGN